MAISALERYAYHKVGEAIEIACGKFSLNSDCRKSAAAKAAIHPQVFQGAEIAAPLIILYLMLSSSLWLLFSTPIVAWLRNNTAWLDLWHGFPHWGFVAALGGLLVLFHHQKNDSSDAQSDRSADLTGRTATSNPLSPLLFERNPQPIWICERETLAFLAANQAAAKRCGYCHSELLAMSLKDLIPAEDLPSWLPLLSQPTDEFDSLPGVWRHRTKSGSLVPVEVAIAAIEFEGRAAALILLQEVGDRLQTEAQLLHADRQYRLLANNFHNSTVMLFDLELRYILAGGQGLNSVDLDAIACEGRTLWEVFPPEVCAILEPLYRQALEGQTAAVELSHANRIYLTQIRPNLDSEGKINGGTNILTDITERKQLERQLQALSFSDTATTLPNKAWFLEELGQQITAIVEDTDKDGVLAVYFLELERFEIVKYSLGHQLAEYLMVATARRIEECLNLTRKVSRVGDRAIALAIRNIPDRDEALFLAEYMQQQLGHPVDLDGYDIFSPARIGIAVAGPTELYFQDPEDLLQSAETAMNITKVEQRANYAIFKPTMNYQAIAQLQLETDLRIALKQEQLQVFYQPIVSLTTGRITGFETLIRWYHPLQGWISPDEFIPLAEEVRLIGRIDGWILEQAAKQLGTWQQQYRDRPPLTLSINASGQLISQSEFIEQLQHAIADNHLKPNTLKLEVTERAIVDRYKSGTRILDEIHALGIPLAIDDFGTGYSCLERLHQLPIDTLKVDRSFVSRMAVDSESSIITRTIVNLAHNLGMDAIAEGIETAEQLHKLRSLNCEYGQGYFFSKPVPSEEAEALLDCQW